MLEEQISECMGDGVDNYSVLHFQPVGHPAEDPDAQYAATVDFRIVAQAREAEAVNESNFFA